MDTGENVWNISKRVRPITLLIPYFKRKLYKTVDIFQLCGRLDLSSQELIFPQQIDNYC